VRVVGRQTVPDREESESARGRGGEGSSSSKTMTTTSLDLPHAALLIHRIKQWRVKSRRAELEKIIGEVHGVDGNLKASTNKALSEDQGCSSSRSKPCESEEEEGSCAISRRIEVKRNDSSYVSLNELSLNQDSKTSLDILKEMLTMMTNKVSMLEKAVRRVQEEEGTPTLDEFQMGLQKQVVSESSLLNAEHFQSLYNELPKRYKRHRWELLYSTARDGTSLQTLYRHVAQVQPTILLVRDMQGHLFGVFAPEPWEVHYKFYGTGETFVFELEPELHMYHWKQSPKDGSKRNDYFMFSTKDCLAVGGGGHFALWLDEDLIHGNSTSSSTFENERLSGSENFQVMSLEVMHMCL
jgi:hypothetical protein